MTFLQALILVKGKTKLTSLNRNIFISLVIGGVISRYLKSVCVHIASSEMFICYGNSNIYTEGREKLYH